MMIKKLLLLCSLLGVLMFAKAQDSNDELLKKLVEKQVLTQQEADEIKAESKSSEKENPLEKVTENVRNIFNNTPYVQLGGYGLFTYQYRNDNKIKHDAQARVIFLSMRGQLTKTIGYFVLGELVHPEIYEFYGKWTPAKEFGVRVGQFKTPLSIENQMALTSLETVFNTRSVSSLIGMGDDVHRLQNGKNNTGRDMGIMAEGNLLERNGHELVQYATGVFQGTGINTSENNNSKDFAFNVMLRPIKEFRIGGGAYWGEAHYEDIKNNIPLGDHVRNRWILSSDYTSDRLYARAEWIHGKDGLIDKEGLYGLAKYYFIPQRFCMEGKVDYFNQNKDENIEVIDYTVGMDYYFYKQCRVQVNYTYSDYSNSSKRWGAKNSHMVLGQLQFVF